ncbi:MAG: hypothetical protein AAE977_00345 [Thermoplasmataceae archaeon]|jgi:hypothetical protein
MVTLNPKWILRIGTALIVASVVLLGISGFGIFSNNHINVPVTLAAGHSYVINSSNQVSSGDDLNYAVSTNSGNVSVLLLQPDGTVFSKNFVTVSSPLNNVIVANQSGIWSLSIYNNGTKAANLTVSFGHLPLTDEVLLYLGFALLPSGVVLVLLTAMIRRKERKMENRGKIL